MRALTLIYSHRVPGFKETQINSIPSRKGIRIPKGSRKRVCQSTGPCHSRPCWSTGPNRELRPVSQSTGPVDRSLPQSTGRSIGIVLCTSCTPVNRAANWPSPPVNRAVDREHNLACSMLRFLLLLIFDLCVNFLYPSISSLSTILHLGEDFPNLSRSQTNSSLSPYEIDTRSRRNRHTISA